LKRLAAEPLVQFLVIGALLWAAFSILQSHRTRQTTEIVIDQSRIALLVRKYQSEMGTSPTRQQLDALISGYVDEEVLYREAKKIGLDADDEVIRRRLAQKYAFLRLDVDASQTPTEEQLREFYSSHSGIFMTDSTVSFSHVYFGVGSGGDASAKQRALAVLEKLKSSHARRAPEAGDRFPLQYDYTNQAALDIRQNFGDAPLLEALFQAPLHQWVGPVQSGYGWHLLFVTDRADGTVLPYEVVREEARKKYLSARRERQNSEMFERLRKHYTVRREDLGTADGGAR